ncbi:Alkanesulfonates transport system permease protein [Rhodovastum atsumiense]|uniref:ABC transporter permease n=1 Tax=Rhodovastum atsumiense TaxID=504468 RepID=A0A5M6IXC5_9PROT|nr:ABC transporter permease [Rhodovastum atsumiense]KAA5612048.1 ABC transporter permease [Rhodovastum atsumiense]CAH2604085.1 Alkanesulfonates transport system permease protein [Rhodovastum atsumiense]
MRRASGHLLAGAALPLGLLAAWEIAARLGAVNAFLLPAPSAVLAAGIELAGSGELGRHVLASAQRVAVGFVLAVALAVPLAVALRRSALLARCLRFPLDFLRATPPLALVPLLVLWFGLGEAVKWTVIVLASFFPILLNTMAGLDSVRPQLLEMARTLQLTGAERVRFIILPAALPTFLAGLRLAFSNCWRALVGAELIATSVGLGYLVMDAQTLARSDIVYAAILVIGTLGFLADWLFVLLARITVGNANGPGLAGS